MTPESSPAEPGMEIDLFFGDHAETVFGSVFDLFGVLECDGTVVNLDGNIFKRTGTNPKLLKGQAFSQTVFWQSSEATPKILEKAIAVCSAGSSEKTTIDFRVHADEKVPFDVTLVPVTSGDKKLIFIGGQEILQSSSRFADVRGENDQLLLAAENADIGLWFWDFANDKIHSTPCCNEIFEVPRYDQLTFEQCLAVVHPADREIVERFIGSARESAQKYSAEFRVLYGDGRIEWISADGKSVHDSTGRPQRMMGALRKITEQKLAADELKRVNDLVKKTRDEAVEANRAKDFFLAFVSHEIRSSLNAIIGWSRILLTKEVDDATRKSALETIERSARTQTKLINDLVDSARVASGKLRLEYRPMDICEAVRGSFEAHRPAAENAKIDYRFESDVEHLMTVGDSARLQQVFSNLISNALKFTPAGGEIVVSLKTGAEAVTVDVSDNGKGISAENLPNVFRQFSQADADGGGGNMGLGLGLSIVKILTERHGGHVRAQSKGLGKGSLFSVTLPITNDPAAVTSKPTKGVEQAQKPLTGLSILIVEDNTDSREVLQMFLEKSGAKVTAVDSARKAFGELEKAAAEIDLLISDLAMPDEDGYSLVSRIRALPEAKGGDLPAIALSAFANDESRRKAHESGFHRYATKPFDHDLLISDILDVLAKYPRNSGQR